MLQLQLDPGSTPAASTSATSVGTEGSATGVVAAAMGAVTGVMAAAGATGGGDAGAVGVASGGVAVGGDVVVVGADVRLERWPRPQPGSTFWSMTCAVPALVAGRVEVRPDWVPGQAEGQRLRRQRGSPPQSEVPRRDWRTQERGSPRSWS